MSVQGSEVLGSITFPPYVQHGSNQHWAQRGTVVRPIAVPLCGIGIGGCYGIVGMDTVNMTRLSESWNYGHGILYKQHDLSLPSPSMVNCSTLGISKNSAFEPYKKTTSAHPQSSKCSVPPLWGNDTRRNDIMKSTVQKEIEDKRNFACMLCNKRFSRHNTLKIHMRIHTGEKPYSCPYCCKSFSQAGNWKVHIRIHTDEKPHICKTCGKRFRQSSTLRSHMFIHTKLTEAYF